MWLATEAQLRAFVASPLWDRDLAIRWRFPPTWSRQHLEHKDALDMYGSPGALRGRKRARRFRSYRHDHLITHPKALSKFPPSSLLLSEAFKESLFDESHFESSTY